MQLLVINFNSYSIAVVLVAEVTQPSLGVGYEIGRAIEMNKKILCLFRPESGRRKSFLIYFVSRDIICVLNPYL